MPDTQEAQTQTVDWRELLRQTPEQTDALRPKSLPEVDYEGEILGHEFGRSSQKKTMFIQFNIRPESCLDPDAAAELEEAGVNLADKIQKAVYYITPKALFQLSDMLDAVLGIQPGRAHDERIPETTNKKVVFKLQKRRDDNGKDTGSNEVRNLRSA